jgi:hypothetical protein
MTFVSSISVQGRYFNFALCGHVLYPHCKEISIYVFPEKELRGLSTNIHIHVTVSSLYIPTIGPPIFLQHIRQTDRGNILIAQRNMNVGPGTVAAQFLVWEYLFRSFGIVSLQCVHFAAMRDRRCVVDAICSRGVT